MSKQQQTAMIRLYKHTKWCASICLCFAGILSYTYNNKEIYSYSTYNSWSVPIHLPFLYLPSSSHTILAATMLLLLFSFLGFSFISSTKQYSQTQSAYSWLSKIAHTIIHMLGWKIHNVTNPMAYQKAIVIAAPHTSNWDFIYGMLFKWAHPGLQAKFAIKKEVMFFPLSYIMKALGAIPIDRKASATQLNKTHNMVAVMAEMLNRATELLIIIAPEGTRNQVTKWKTGFYRLAETTNLPIILGYIDYGKKELGFGPLFYTTGDIDKDIAEIQNFYRKIEGKYPAQGVI